MKKFLVIILSIMMVLSSVTAFASSDTDWFTELDRGINDDQDSRIESFRLNSREDQIAQLMQLGVIQGTDKGMELEKGLTRAEGTVVFARLFDMQGKFNDANENHETGFVDVPKWAELNINYLHEKGIIYGVSEDKFGSNNPMTAAQFTTMVLRGLGYSDTDGDFEWNKSLEKAVEVGLITAKEKSEIETTETFTRGQMAIVAYNTLFAKNINTGKHVIVGTVRINTGEYSEIGIVEINKEEQLELEKALGDINHDIFKNDVGKLNRLMGKIEPIMSKVITSYDIILNNKKIEITPIKLVAISSKEKYEVPDHIVMETRIKHPELGNVTVNLGTYWKLVDGYINIGDMRTIDNHINTTISEIVYDFDEYRRDWDNERNLARRKEIGEEFGVSYRDISVSIIKLHGKEVGEVISYRTSGSLNMNIISRRI